MTVGIVLAGGAGSRLAPWTPSRAKFLIDFFDEPLIAVTLRALRSMQADRLLILAAEDVLEDANWVRAEYCSDIEVVRCPSWSWKEVWTTVARCANGDRSLIVNCDLLVGSGWFGFVDHHLQEGNILSVAATSNFTRCESTGKHRRRRLNSNDVVDVHALCRDVFEVGLSVIEPVVWDSVLPYLEFCTEDPFSDELIDAASCLGQVGYCFNLDDFFDCGTWDGVLSAHLFNGESHPGWRFTQHGSWIHDSAWIAEGVVVRDSLIGPKSKMVTPGEFLDCVSLRGGVIDGSSASQVVIGEL